MVSRLAIENLAIDRLGLRQPAFLVVPPRCLQIKIRRHETEIMLNSHR